jgi:hypothetical protein
LENSRLSTKVHHSQRSVANNRTSITLSAERQSAGVGMEVAAE